VVTYKIRFVTVSIAQNKNNSAKKPYLKLLSPVSSMICGTRRGYWQVTRSSLTPPQVKDY